MNIDDLIQLLGHRLREFKLSRDYAKMSGNLERMNSADKEIIGLEDTLYKLSLLADASKSAIVKETVLSEVLTDGSVAVLGEYDITPYATDPMHEQKIMNFLSKMGVMDTVEKIDGYIKSWYPSSPVTGEMVMSAALAYNVDTRLMMAIMQQDSSFGTAGLAVRTLNPGNVGNDDDGNTRTYESWQEGVTAVAAWLNRHRGSTPIYENSLDNDLEPAATSTPPITTPTTGTTTPATTTPDTATTTPPVEDIFTDETAPIVTSTTTTATTTQDTATTTPPIEDIFTDETVPVVNSTTTPATTTPDTATTTPPIEDIFTDETVPVDTSTTTPAPTIPITSTTTTIITSTTTTPVTATSTAN